MKLSLAFVFASMLLTVGCASRPGVYVQATPAGDVMPETFPVYIDTLFTVKEHDQIHAAMADSTGI